MELDRALIKSQAKQLMKDRTINLFIITMILGLVMTIFNTSINVDNIYNDSILNGNNNSEYYDGNDSSNDNPIENFGNDLFDKGFFDGVTGEVVNTSLNTYIVPRVINRSIGRSLSAISTIATILLAPLEIGIAMLYLRLSRNEFDGFGKELDNSFRAAFDRNYLKKVLVLLVRKLLIGLFTMLLIIPGIIKHYELCFVEYISADKSGLTVGQTNDLSKKLTRDHKMELFKLDLSFIPWFILCGLTFGIALIYVVPYYQAVKALYYQNFKARCIQEMKITDIDYMTDEERTQTYNSQHHYQNVPNGSQYYNQAQGFNMGNNEPNNSFNAQQGYNQQYNYNSVNSYDPRYQSNMTEPNVQNQNVVNEANQSIVNNPSVAPTRDFAQVEKKDIDLNFDSNTDSK